MTGRMDCVFCDIIEGKRPARVVYENEGAVAFHDVRPAGPTHVLVVPRRHVEKTTDLGEGDGVELAHLFEAVRRAAGICGVQDSGFRLAVNQGPDALQTVFHLHFHLIGGRRMTWPPG